MIQYDIHNQLGQGITALAFLLNLVMGEEINTILTLVISGLSIVYLALKIRREISEAKERKRTKKDADQI